MARPPALRIGSACPSNPRWRSVGRAASSTQADIRSYQTWEDERVFQTARNIVIVMFIKIVVEEYINHISPAPFRLRADPSVTWTARWNRTNWITAEFSLLYRWHSLMPDVVEWGQRRIPLKDWGFDNRPLTDAGLEKAFRYSAAQTAGQVGFNTAKALLGFELAAIKQARGNEIERYNEYRRAFGLEIARTFEDISKDPVTIAKLKSVYDTPDQVEFYPGLFAETPTKNCPLPRLILTMVAVDAFSQALTNPLLSEHVFNKTTFTPLGWDEIGRTSSLRDLLARNVQGGIGEAKLGMTRADWSFEW